MSWTPLRQAGSALPRAGACPRPLDRPGRARARVGLLNYGKITKLSMLVQPSPISTSPRGRVPDDVGGTRHCNISDAFVLGSERYCH